MEGLGCGADYGIDADEAACVIPQDLASAFGDSVEELDFQQANLYGTVPNIASAYPNLQALNLNDNPNLEQGNVFPWIWKFTRLKRLHLANANRVGDLEEVKMSLALQNTLQVLNLGQNPKFSLGSFPSWLGTLKSLEELNMQSTNRAGDLGLVDLRRSMKTLRTLMLQDNPGVFPGPVPEWLASIYPQNKLMALSDSKSATFVPTRTINLEGLNIYGTDNPSKCAYTILEGYSCEKAKLCSASYNGYRCSDCTRCGKPWLMCAGPNVTCQVPKGIVAAVGRDATTLDFSHANLIGSVPAMVGLESLVSLDVSHNQLLSEDQDWSWASGLQALNLDNSNQKIRYGDTCNRNGNVGERARCPRDSLCRHRCCAPEISANCSACTNNGQCFNSLFTVEEDPASAWSSTNITAWNGLDTDSLLLNQGIARFIGAPKTILATLRRQREAGPGMIFVSAGATNNSYTEPPNIKYSVRWTDPHDANDDVYRGIEIGDHPPTGLVASGQIENADPGRFYVDKLDGSIIAAPRDKGNFIMWLIAGVTETKESSYTDSGVNRELEEVVVAKWNITVREKDAFEVTQFERFTPNKETGRGEHNFTTEAGLGRYEVGTVYYFKPINVTKTLHTSDSVEQIKFALQGAPPGFLIDPADGYIQGQSLNVDNFTMQIFAVDSRNEMASLKNITMHFEHRDTHNKTNGPNGKGCRTEELEVDADKFDGLFTCDCSNEENVEPGDLNCDYGAGAAASSAGTSVVGGVLGGLIVITLLLVASLKYREYRRSLIVHDFHATLQAMADAGEIDPALLQLMEGAAANGEGAFTGIPREIKRSNLTFMEKIGAGAFGDVWRAVLDESSAGGVPGYTVALKTCQVAGGEGEEDMVREATVMAMVSPHENVVPLIGVVTSGLPKILVVPLCENGSMLSFLQERAAGPPEDALQFDDKIVMAHDIAKGMAHLVKHHFVHRDLAARNVLVNGMFVCSIADFGLSRAVASSTSAEDGDDEVEEEYYRSARGQFPVRWTAPEAMETSIFTTYTDVWSFAVVCAEIWDDGGKPYDGLDNMTVMNRVMAGKTMDKPELCTDEVWNEIILPCFSFEPTSRPTFDRLAVLLNGATSYPDPPIAKFQNLVSKVIQGANADPDDPLMNPNYFGGNESDEEKAPAAASLAVYRPIYSTTAKKKKAKKKAPSKKEKEDGKKRDRSDASVAGGNNGYQQLNQGGGRNTVRPASADYNQLAPRTAVVANPHFAAGKSAGPAASNVARMFVKDVQSHAAETRQNILYERPEGIVAAGAGSSYEYSEHQLPAKPSAGSSYEYSEQQLPAKPSAATDGNDGPSDPTYFGGNESDEEKGAAKRQSGNAGGKDDEEEVTGFGDSDGLF